MFRGVQFLFLPFVFALVGQLKADQVNLEIGNEESIDATPYLQELRGDRSIADALTADWKSIKEVPNYGFQEGVFFFRLRLKANKPETRVFVIDASIRDLDLFVIREGDAANAQKFSLGRLVPPDANSPPYRAHLRRVEIPSGITDFVFRVSNDDQLRFPLEIWRPDAFEIWKDQSNFFFGIFFGSMIVMVLYNLFVYLSTGEASYRSYILYTLAGSAYFFIRLGFFRQFFGSHYLNTQLVLLCLGLYMLTLAIFVRSFLETRKTMRIFHHAFTGIMIGAVCVSIIGMIPGIPIGPIAKFGATTSIAEILITMIVGIVAWKRGNTVARYFVFAFALFWIFALLYALRAIGLVPHNFFTAHGVQIGSVVELTLLSLALSDRINFLKRSLEKHARELELTHRQLATSEKKYRTLVEDTGDLIFSLDMNGHIATMNRASGRLLGLSPTDLFGKSIFDLVYRKPDASVAYDTMMLKETMASLAKTPAQFRMLLKSRNGEPIDLGIRLEKIGSGNEAMILGKATVGLEDVLVKYLRSENGQYVIDNYIGTTELLNQRITRNLPRFLSQEDVEGVQFSLREMLTNAIEHGNLEISYDEKTRSQADGSYLNFIRARQNMEKYRDRNVRVEFSLNYHRIWFRITDQGRGFDHENYMRAADKHLSDMHASHGRGIALTRQLFEVMRYNSVGNQVTLVRFLNASN